MNAREYYLSIRDDRDLWRQESGDRCFWCPNRSFKGLPLEVHEIERRSQAPRSWGQRCNYLLLCHKCHSETFSSLPHPTQLAIKLLADPKNFSLEKWLRIKDPELMAPNRVTGQEIAEAIKADVWKRVIKKDVLLKSSEMFRISAVYSSLVHDYWLNME